MTDFTRLTRHYDLQRRPRMLIVHGMALPWSESDRILRGESDYEVSCQYAISHDGEIVQYTANNDRAWHAGAASWSGFQADLNSMAIGVELQCGVGEPHFQTPQSIYTDAQMQTFIPWAQKITADYKIEPWHVLGHQDIAPDRKPDPGLNFDWALCAKHGIGLWHDLEPSTNDPVVTDPIRIAQFKRDLTFYGYDHRPQIAGENHEHVITAFQTHFLPWHICGQVTEQSIEALAILLEKKYGR